jgi:hypothetical protein
VKRHPFLISLPVVKPMPKKRALIIGINQYHPLIGRLGGCVNDATQIKQLLNQSYAFPDDEIKELVDQTATRDAILGGLDWLIGDARAGDVLVVFYSGHGTRLPNPADPSGKDEVLVAFSPEWENLLANQRDANLLFLETNWDLQFIRDKEVKAHLDKLADDVNLTLLMDCCHSGDVNRDIRSFPRYLEPSQNVQAEIIEAQQAYWQHLQENTPEPTGNEYKLNREQAIHLIQKVFRGNRFDFVTTAEKNILLAACSEKETALEKVIDGKRGGVFTHHLIDVLGNGDKLTYAGLILALGEKMRFTPQMPRLACPDRFRQLKVFDTAVI